MKLQIKYILLGIPLFVFAQANAQETQQDSTEKAKVYYLIKKSDGGELKGYILSDDGREILLETKNIGKLYINKSDIQEIVAISESESNIDNPNYGEFRETGPFTTRYYFTNNALPVKKGEDYAMIKLYGPEVHFSDTDKLSLGVMASWIASPIAVAAKYSIFSKGKTHLSLGTIIGSSGYIAQGRIFGGLHWLTLTFGDRRKNFSISGGYGYVKDNADLLINRNPSPEFVYQTYDSYQPYYVNYQAENAVAASVGNRQFTPSIANFEDAIFIGLGGIAPVGKKASFILDGMVALNQKQDLVYSDHQITVEYEYNPDPWGGGVPTMVTEKFIIGRGELTSSLLSTTIICMPGMRFNSSYSSAFQIALAGVIYIDGSGNGISFPIPMVSWLKKF